MNFETVIGLEVHIALNTDSKVYSPSTNGFEAEPNENVNPIDLAYPGTLPLINEEAINYAMKAAMALNCEIATDTNFDRKNYYYPDMPKAYQISQDDKPIGQNGWVDKIGRASCRERGQGWAGGGGGEGEEEGA